MSANSRELTAREKKFLAARILGYDLGTIAAVFNLTSSSTVKGALNIASGKIGTRGQSYEQVARVAKERGLITDADVEAVRTLAIPATRRGEGAAATS